MLSWNWGMVTRLGDCFTIFEKRDPNFLGYVLSSTLKVKYKFFLMALGYFLGDFFTNSSGHPVLGAECGLAKCPN
jgi:hypothetical protein